MDSWKEVIIISRPERAKDTEAALLGEGAAYLTRQSVTGRGKEMGLTLIPTWFGIKPRSSPFLRKVLLTAMVPKKKIPNLVKAVLAKNRTGKFGDGKIFILPARSLG